MKTLSLYIHIPFCVRKCSYCDFLSFPAGEWAREAYVNTLLEEIDLEAENYREYEVQTVFFGGGTPSLLTVNQMERIMEQLYDCFQVAENAEISMEVNPGTVTENSLIAYREAGINRLSIGLQSAQDAELQMLGRIHTYDMFLEAYDAAVSAGFSNINIDLMSALPSQSVESYTDTLQKILHLAPRPMHISAYSLIVEEGTPFYEREQAGKLPLPSEEEERAMYELTGQLLLQRGYKRYEISNYALPEYECRHNQVYWNRGDYLGLGLGASSMVNNVRMKNETVMEAYHNRVRAGEFKADRYALSKQEQMEETMFLGLRLIKGVEKAAFARTFECSMESIYGDIIQKHVQNGLLEDGDFVRLTSKGIDVSNYVMSDFLF